MQIDKVENQQVEVNLNLTLWLDASWNDEQIGDYIRHNLYKAFPYQVEVIQENKFLDILNIKQEAEIFGNNETITGEDNKLLEEIFSIDYLIEKLALHFVTQAKLENNDIDSAVDLAVKFQDDLGENLGFQIANLWDKN